MLGLIKEGMIELMEECLGDFRADLAVGQLGDRSFTFLGFYTYGAHAFF